MDMPACHEDAIALPMTQEEYWAVLSDLLPNATELKGF